MRIWAGIRWAFGLDSERAVSHAVNDFTSELLTGREAEIVYETCDEREAGLVAWTSGELAAGNVATHLRASTDPRYTRAGHAADGFDPTAAYDAFWFGTPLSMEDEEWAQFAPATTSAGPVEPVPVGPITFGSFGPGEIEFDGDVGEPRGDQPPTGDSTTPPSKPGLLKRRRKAEVARMVRLASAAAKVKFGLPKATEANLLVVGKFVRDWLEEYGMRPTHIAGVAPLATALTFIPSRADVMMREMLASEAAVDMDTSYRAVYYSRAPVTWWDPTTWFGRAYARPFAG